MEKKISSAREYYELESSLEPNTTVLLETTEKEYILEGGGSRWSS